MTFEALLFAAVVTWLVFVSISAALADPGKDDIVDVLLLVPYWRLAPRIAVRLARLIR